VANAHTLFVRHHDGVFRYLSRILGQAETARDLTQEVFLRVSRSAVPAATEIEHRAWVFTIARNLALNHLRDARRRPEATVLQDTAKPATQELAAALGQALAALGDLDRDVFLLRETAGLGYDEIAAACGLTVEAVRGRLQRAREQLRDTLGGPIDAQRRRGVRLTSST